MFYSVLSDNMDGYHPRQSRKEITWEDEMTELILGQKHLTMALCKDNMPYISTVNYYYDPAGRFFYFHCSPEGKKIDILKVNPVVWGQVMEDLGYIQGECDHAYRTVQFKGRVEIVGSKKEKISALTLMMDRLENDPADDRKRGIKNRDLAKVAIGKIHIEGMSGKVNPSRK